MADATDRRTKALMKISQLNQDITKARQTESYRRLAAPVDGSVQGLKIHTRRGGHHRRHADNHRARPRRHRGRLPGAEQGHRLCRRGQDVEVSLEAFPFTRYAHSKRGTAFFIRLAHGRKVRSRSALR
jgi:hemolysin D